MKTIIKVSAAGGIVLTVFSISFFAFYKRAEGNKAKQPLILTSAVINQPLPKSNLVSISDKKIADEELRQGRIVLAFVMPDCEPCGQEIEFLKPIIKSRNDVRFIYVIPFGNKDWNLKSAGDKCALEPFFDVGTNLARKLQLRQVPLKLFVKDGIIKGTFIDSAITPQIQNDFKTWFASL